MSNEHKKVFVVNDVSKIVKEIVDRVIASNGYEVNQANRWTANIVDQALTELDKLGKSFKYVVYAVSRGVRGRAVAKTNWCRSSVKRWERACTQPVHVCGIMQLMAVVQFGNEPLLLGKYQPNEIFLF